MTARIKEHHYNWECPVDEMLTGKNQMRTKSLFAEMIPKAQVATGHVPVYSLGDTDRWWTIPEEHPTRGGERIFLLSAYLIYMASVDEYEAATKIVGSNRHWQALVNVAWMKNGWFRHPGIEDWREDMRLRDLSYAKRTLEQAVSDGNVTAAKALYDQSKSKKTAGRPKKEKENKIDDTEEIDNLYKNVIELKKD